MSKQNKDIQSRNHSSHSNGGHEGGAQPGATRGPDAAAASKPIVLQSESAAKTEASGSSSPEAAGPAGSRSGETAALQAEIAKLKAELEEKTKLLAAKEKEAAELKDKYLRALAESENARRRIRQQSEETIRWQREQLLRDVLPIADNLERAVGAAQGGGNGKSIVEGVEMVLSALLDFLKQQGVTPQTAVGQRFDPARHEAVSYIPSDVHPPNTVVEEAHRGYQIGDRVLRPARVVVARGPDMAKEPNGHMPAGQKDGEDEH